VSLILEALKKVERERATPEQRGFLVLGPAAWAPARSNAGWILGIFAAAGIAGGMVYALTRPDTAPAAAAPATGIEVPTGPAARPPELAPVGPPATAAWQPPAPSEAARRSAPPASAATGPPPPAATPPGPVLALNAISAQDGVPIAVINDRVVREGDRFDGVRVLRIGAAEVEVEIAGARRVLRF
jgi:hypothetical protein